MSDETDAGPAAEAPPPAPTEAEIAAAVARRALPLLDLTELSDYCDDEDVERLCARAVTPYGPVAAVCVWPKFVDRARAFLGRGSPVRVATVVNFPTGRENVLHAESEVELVNALGAHEIDLVMPYRAFAEGRADSAARMIRTVRVAARARIVKVILETGMLREPGLIRRAADLAIAEGADFVKTSTGKVEVNATPEAVVQLLEAAHASGRRVGVKPSGGIRTVRDAATYLALADAIMGVGWVSRATFRFGASSLLDALIAAIEGGDGGKGRPAPADAASY
jgi:deoxyribose-phosphate aldolase